jgi:general secretion pathway protein G
MEKSRGITLFGMLVVLILLGIIAYFVIPMLGASKQERLAHVKQDLTAFQASLEQYKLDNGAYPTTEQGLKALVEEPTVTPAPQFWKSGGYIATIPMDPWGQAYQYKNENDVLRVYSYGPGGKDGVTEIDLTNVDKL